MLGATHHLPGHHFAAVFAEVRGQAPFTAGTGQHAEAQFGTIAAFFRPLQAGAAIGDSVSAGFHGKAAVFADFVEGKQPVIT